MIDHRPAGVAQHRARGIKTFGADIGIADAVEDHIVGGQRDFGVAYSVTRTVVWKTCSSSSEAVGVLPPAAETRSNTRIGGRWPR